MLEAGSLPDAAIGLDPGANAGNFEQATKVNPNVPFVLQRVVPRMVDPLGRKMAAAGYNGTNKRRKMADG